MRDTKPLAASRAPMRPTSVTLAATLRGLVLAAVALALGACQPPQARGDAAGAGAPADTVSVTVDSVNYQHERAVQYTLYDLSRTPPLAVGGALVVMLATGGEKGCCVSLPKTWRPGLKVRVDWEESDRQVIYPEKYSRELEIPRYDSPADLFVVFHPAHEVELGVSPAEPGHPDWRGRIRNTPWEQCVEAHGRKPCKAALPKTFGTGSQGMCTYFKEEKLPDADDLCATLMAECMKDWEDQPFCDGVLWGPRKKQ